MQFIDYASAQTKKNELDPMDSSCCEHKKYYLLFSHTLLFCLGVCARTHTVNFRQLNKEIISIECCLSPVLYTHLVDAYILVAHTYCLWQCEVPLIVWSWKIPLFIYLFFAVVQSATFLMRFNLDNFWGTQASGANDDVCRSHLACKRVNCQCKISRQRHIPQLKLNSIKFITK